MEFFYTFLLFCYVANMWRIKVTRKPCWYTVDNPAYFEDHFLCCQLSNSVEQKSGKGQQQWQQWCLFSSNSLSLQLWNGFIACPLKWRRRMSVRWASLFNIDLTWSKHMQNYFSSPLPQIISIYPDYLAMNRDLFVCNDNDVCRRSHILVFVLLHKEGYLCIWRPFTMWLY